MTLSENGWEHEEQCAFGTVAVRGSGKDEPETWIECVRKEMFWQRSSEFVTDCATGTERGFEIETRLPASSTEYEMEPVEEEESWRSTSGKTMLLMMTAISALSHYNCPPFPPSLPWETS